MEVYIAQFPGAAVKRQISIDGGDQPLWAPDGKQLFYVNGNRIMSVDLNSRIRTASHQAARVIRKNVFFIRGRQRHLGTHLGGVSRWQAVPVRRQSRSAGDP